MQLQILTDTDAELAWRFDPYNRTGESLILTDKDRALLQAQAKLTARQIVTFMEECLGHLYGEYASKDTHTISDQDWRVLKRLIK